MKGIVFALLPLILALFGRAGQSGSDNAALEAKAKAFITQLAQGDTAGAMKRFWDPKQTEPSLEEMGKGWGVAVQHNGPLERITQSKFEKVQTFDGQRFRIILLSCVFQQRTLAVRVHFNDQGFVTGFHITRPG